MAYPQHQNLLSVPTLRFAKTANQIREALLKRIDKQTEKQMKLRMEVEEICKRRELDAEEVYAAGNNEAAIATYSTKMSSSYTQAPRSIIEALQKDIERLSELGRQHASRVNGIAELQRVADNFEDGARVFDLTYSELATLGF